MCVERQMTRRTGVLLSASEFVIVPGRKTAHNTGMRRVFGIAVLTIGYGAFGAAFAQSPADAAVLKVEDEFRLARIRNDVAALERIVDDGYLGVNQWGNRRGKAQFLERYRVLKT